MTSASPPSDTEPGTRKPHWKAVLAAWVFGFAVAGIYYVVRNVPAAGWRLHDVTTGVTLEYPALQSRLYDATPGNATVLAAAAASRLAKWKVIRTDITAHRVECEVTTTLGLRTDEVTISITPSGPDENASRVQIHSRSRLATPDLGENARHIADLQSAMDDKLPRINP